MRSMARPAATLLFAISLALIAIVGGSSLARAADKSPCIVVIGADGGLRCPANKCGFLLLKTCTIIIWIDPVTGLPTGEQTCECR